MPPCDAAQTDAIQARLNADAPGDIDAVAVVKDPSCGLRYFTRGPSKHPMTTVHLIASNTKTYVASLILLLADDGLVDLDESISKWIAKVPGGDAVRVRHLLNHQSGLYNYSANLFFQGESALGRKWTPQQLVDLSFEQKVKFEAGKSWEYSNTNYILLGMIAEKVTEKPVEQLLRERILEPTGAKATYFHGKEEVKSTVAFGRTALGTNGYHFNDPSAFWSAGAYIATAEDLANWIEVRGSGKFHSEKANAELFKEVPTTVTGYRWGAGLMIQDAALTHGAGTGYGHGGDLTGYHSAAMYFPDSRTTVILIVDSDQGPERGYPFGATYREKLLFSVIDPLFGYQPPSDAGAD